jgi:PAS domain S-box-containing protein
MNAKPAQAARLDTQLFYDAFTASPIGIAIENLEGQPLFVNTALCTMLGFSENEMCGKHCLEFSPPEDAEKDWALFEELRAGARDHYQIEKRFYRRNGSLIWGRLSVSLFNYTSPMVIAMVEDITDKKLVEQAFADVSRKLVKIQEQERTRIARDLHDDINQRLAMVAVEVDQLVQNLPDSAAEMRRRLDEIKEQITEVSTGVQSLSHQLHSPQLEYLGIVAAIRSFCREFAKRRQVEIDFAHGDDIPQHVSQEISLCLFRIVQEGLNNAARHSTVQRFEVKLDRVANQLHLKVCDQGAGFDMAAGINKEGLGLISMRERVRLVGGTIVIESKPMGGTCIAVRVPIESAPGGQRAVG